MVLKLMKEAYIGPEMKTSYWKQVKVHKWHLKWYGNMWIKLLLTNGMTFKVSTLGNEFKTWCGDAYLDELLLLTDQKFKTY